MRRKIGCLAVGGGGAALLLAALAFVEIDSPALGRVLLARAGSATGASIEAAEFRLSLLRGLSLRQVRANGNLTGGRYDVTLDRLVFEHRWLPLLRGQIAVHRVRLESPRIRMEETGRTAARKRAPAPASSAGLPLSIRISEIAIEDGAVELRAPGQPPVAVHGLDILLRDLDLQPSAAGPLAGLSAAGKIAIGAITLAPTHVRDVRGTFTLAKGRFESQDLRLDADEGPVEARCRAELQKLPFAYTLAVRAAPLDLDQISGMAGRGGRFGPGHLVLDARGAGPEPEALTGTGTLELEAGTLPGTPLLTAMEAALGRTRLVGAAYKATSSPYRIRDGRVSFERLRFETETAGLDVGGWTAVDGRMDMTVAVRAPRAQVRIAEVPTDVIDALVDEEGWVSIPLRVTGTRAAPRVVPDVAALTAQAGRGGARVIKKKAVDKLKGLFGGRD